MITPAKGIVVAVLVGGSFFGGSALARGSGDGPAAAGPDASGTRATPATVVTGQCAVGKTSFVSSDIEGYGLTSTTYVDVPDMAVTFSVPGTTRSCATAEFSAYTSTAADQLMMIRAVMDGVTVGAPFEVLFDGDSDEDGDGRWARAHAFTFLFPSVQPGKHTIKIQWRSFSGGTVVMSRRTLIVDHK
jgi:hypothetical protein